MDLTTKTDRTLNQFQVMDFVRFAGSIASSGDIMSAEETFLARWPQSTHKHMVQKAAAEAGSWTPGSWAASLALSDLASAFLEYVRPQTIIGRLNLRRVPFLSRISQQTGTSAAYAWRKAGEPLPVVAAAFDTLSLEPLGAGGIIVVTHDLARLSRPGAEPLLRDELRDGLVTFQDRAFVDPNAAAVQDESPASITHGVTPTASTTPAADIKQLISDYSDAGGSLASAVFLLSPANAVALRLSGGDAYRELGPTGGSIAGIPAIASEALQDQVVLLDPRRVLLADDGGIQLDGSSDATVVMDSGTSPQSTTTIELWQKNMRGLKITRIMNWRRLGAIAIVNAADYTA